MPQCFCAMMYSGVQISEDVIGVSAARLVSLVHNAVTETQKPMLSATKTVTEVKQKRMKSSATQFWNFTAGKSVTRNLCGVKHVTSVDVV